MNVEIDLLAKWLDDVGIPKILETGEHVTLTYQHFYTAHEPGGGREMAHEAQHAMNEFEQALVLVQVVKRRIESLAG